jgi:tetratricopeptide (TPR) repeat protein
MDGLAAAREAAERGAWASALDELAASGPAARSAEGLELRARAEYGNGGFEASVSAWEDLHRVLLDDGDIAGAAMAAAMVAMFLMMDTGLMAPVRGWVRRAERVLEGHGEAPAHAMIAVVHAYERFMSGDMEAARGHAARGIELGRRFGVDPAVVIGRVCTARIRIFDGAVDEGLGLLDEIAVDLMAGIVDPLTTGMMYCELICAAQGMALHDRASQWTDVMEQWRHGAAIGGISGRCRVHRAEILRVSGPCDVAEAEALSACEELRPWMRREFGWPLVELGTIRLRKGDLAGAEEAFLAAHHRAWSPHPGLALLRLEQGDVAEATRMIADAIAHPYAIPSKMRPPFGDLRLAPLLDAQAEIASVAGDEETVRVAADALDAIASSYPSSFLAASAAVAQARASLVGGDLQDAIHRAKGAAAVWADLGAPFEAAVAQTVLGEARRRAGDESGARLEWSAARSAFETFGAVLRAEHLRQLLSDIPPETVSGASTHRTVATFRCDGDTRTIGYGGVTVLMRDLTGLRYIERLLADPGREIHVLDLVAVERGTLPTGRRLDRSEAFHDDAGAGMPIIDDAARQAYRRRLAEVDDDIDEATAMNDLGRIELAQRDRDYLIAELAGATGLHGSLRTSGGTSERARTSVTRSVRYALGRMAPHHAALAAHLDQTVRTGTYCVYRPDPIAPLVWEV